MEYILRNDDNGFILTEDNGVSRFVPNDPRNTDYQRIKEDYDVIEGEKPFVWPN